MKTIRFNTKRLYTKAGQRIVATLHDDGVVTFFDHDRMVHGEFEFIKGAEDLFNQVTVMDAYDHYRAPGTGRAWKDGMQRGGCNTDLGELA